MIYYLLKGLALSSCIGYLFYKNIIAIILLSPYCFIYLKNTKKKLIEARKWDLNIQFRDGIASISAALNAGISIENSFYESLKDLRLMYKESDYIVKEFEYIVNQLHRNKTVEETLHAFALRSGVEDIDNFAEVFITAKRTGGDIIKIIRSSSKTISDKIEVKREIHTLITAKRFETRIMNLIPFGIIGYMWIFSPGFLDPLYQNIIGRIIMTIALCFYYIAFHLSEKIINIKI